MKPVQKALTTCLWIVFVLAMVSVIGAGLWRGRLRGPENAGDLLEEELIAHAERRDPLAAIAEVPPFSLVDQNGKPMTRDDLKGTVWIASFVFTRCAGPCPMMTAKMSMLHRAIDDPGVHFVTFTVDPEHDTPAVLKQYAKSHHADEARWHFLTGNKITMFNLSHGMLLPAAPASDDKPILHSERFVLVDTTGKIRNYYGTREGADIERLKVNAAALIAQTSRAASNATRPVSATQARPAAAIAP